MVCPVNLPSDDSLATLDNILSERVKFKSFFTAIETDLKTNFRGYIVNKGNPELINIMDLSQYTSEVDDRKTTLKGLYSPRKDKYPFKELERIRKHNGLVVCPSCGELGRPRTLDHYLPKDIFPEYSILLANLVPMCDWCQGAKGTMYKTDSNKKKFIHPYFDKISVPVYFFKFSKPFSSPIISLTVNPDLDSELTRLAHEHLTGINLLERYVDYFSTSYISIMRKAKEYKENGNINNFRSYLTSCLSIFNDKAINSWDSVLYRSILLNPEILEYLEQGNLPKNL